MSAYSTDLLKPGQYSSIEPNTVLAKSSRAPYASQHQYSFCDYEERERAACVHTLVQPPARLYGAYWQNNDATCLPGGASVGSCTDGIVISITGARDGMPLTAQSRYAASICSHVSELKWIVPLCCGPDLPSIVGKHLKFGSESNAIYSSIRDRMIGLERFIE